MSCVSREGFDAGRIAEVAGQVAEQFRGQGITGDCDRHRGPPCENAETVETRRRDGTSRPAASELGGLTRN